jgi:hypothetical protein
VAAYVRPNVNYCQGMNYMGAFLLQLTGSEEEGFYFLVAVLSNTEYSHIFYDDLSKLKQFFYVFERLLSIYTPELSQYLKKCGINVSYFCSPWFITLFSNCYQHITESGNPKVLIRIWDDFLLVRL